MMTMTVMIMEREIHLVERRVEEKVNKTPTNQVCTKVRNKMGCFCEVPDTHASVHKSSDKMGFVQLRTRNQVCTKVQNKMGFVKLGIVHGYERENADRVAMSKVMAWIEHSWLLF